MKRFLAAAIAGALVAGILAGPVQARPREGRWSGPCSGWQYGEFLNSPAKYNRDLARSERMTRRLVACVFNHWAPGNIDHAMYVADRESGFYPWAYNSSSGCMGLFQHIEWTGRIHYLWRGHFNYWPPKWQDPRANAIIAAKMVAAGGWGPWGG